MDKQHQNSSHEHHLPARKIQRLLEYLDNVGLDSQSIASACKIDLKGILSSTAEDKIPSIYYALIYKESVAELERIDKQVPWAAGLGSQTFRMMCYCIISCKTLGDALIRAEKFNQLMFPLVGQQVSLLSHDASSATVQYDMDDAFVRRSFSPTNWTMQECLSVAKSSGVEMWLGLCGWLIGRKIEPIGATFTGQKLFTDYETRLSEIFQCPLEFEAACNSIVIPADILNFRIVHDNDSLEDFLDTGPYQLWSTDNKLISTTAAVKSLLGNDFSGGMPSFETMASNVHMSASTLRRHLLHEGSSYQKIKDQRRRDIAIEYLCLSDDKISDISEQIGFSDTSSFVRSFRSWTGITPKAYRDQARPLRLSTELQGQSELALNSYV